MTTIPSSERSGNDKLNDKKVTCSEYIISTLKQADHALNYPDFGNRFSYGILRNEMSKHAKNGGVLRLLNECPGRFILPEWAHRPEYYCVIRNSKKGRVGGFDYLSYLASLDWGSVLAVHDLKLSFAVYQFRWAGVGWEYCKESRSFSCRFNLSCPVSVQCFDTGTVLVSVKCSSKPFPLDLTGLVALSNLLGEVKACLHAPCIPDPDTWCIVQWHLNRDSEKLQGGGADVYLTFRDFFEDSAQFYYKRELSKIRAEVVQTPKRSVKEVFESILNRTELPPEIAFKKEASTGC